MRQILSRSWVPLVHLGLCSLFTLFLSSNYRLWNNWYWVILSMGIVEGILFVTSARIALQHILENNFVDHFVIITKKGVSLYCTEIRVSSDGSNVAGVNGDSVSYTDSESVRFIDEVTKVKTIRRSFMQFLQEMKKENNDR
jgi:hypothetical protein